VKIPSKPVRGFPFQNNGGCRLVCRFTFELHPSGGVEGPQGSGAAALIEVVFRNGSGQFHLGAGKAYHATKPGAMHQRPNALDFVQAG